jgi:tetratricopeptide (TPR) repeat protein
MNLPNQYSPQANSNFATLNRIVWKTPSHQILSLYNFGEEIIQKASKLENTGGILTIPYNENDEVTILLLLSFLIGKFRRNSKSVQLYRPQIDAYLKPQALSADYLLIHNLPHSAGLLENLISQDPKQVIIATGTIQELEQLQILVPHQIYKISDTDKLENNPKEIILAEVERYLSKQNQNNWDIYFLVALFDSWGIPLPFSLLSKSSQQDEDLVGEWVEDAQSEGLLFWLELDSPPGLLVSTKAPNIARSVIDTILKKNPTDVSKYYSNIINLIDVEEKEERYTGLKLFQALAHTSYKWDKKLWGNNLPQKKWVRNLLNSCQAHLREIWKNTDSLENLFWGKFLEDIGDFQLSSQVFDYAIEKDPNNPFLLQSRARMYAKWSQLDRSQYDIANEMFKRATDKYPNNPYIWQAWGVMQTQFGSSQDARNSFKQALSAANNNLNAQIYTNIGWVTLELEAKDANYVEAKKLIDATNELTKQNLYLLHTQAKLSFYEGKYDTDSSEAKTTYDYLTELLQLDPNNLPTFNMLGNISLKRGHIKEAQSYLTKAIEIDPENIPTLHALGELNAEEASLLLEIGNSEQVNSLYKKAQSYFDQILELEPSNIQTLASYSTMLLKWSDFNKQDKNLVEKAESLLHFMQELVPDSNFVSHIQGKLYQYSNRLLEAETCFQEILDKDSQNFPALLSLLQLRSLQGDEDEDEQLIEELEYLLSQIEEHRVYMPTYDVVRIYAAWTKVKLGLKKLDEAKEMINKAKLLDKNNAYLHCIEAEIHKLENKEELANLCYELAIKLIKG